MNRVVAVVEGQTERTFMRDVLAPFLGTKGVMLSARLIGKPGRKGGVGSFARARTDIANLLNQEGSTIVTTMFDYYGMPGSWPGRKAAMRLRHDRKAVAVERAIVESLAQHLGASFDSRRMMPYVQMHEFESLLFAQPAALCDVMRDATACDKLNRVRETFSTPEEINDSPNTAPSKRIAEVFPYYQKALHGILAVKRIGIDTMRAACPHFNEWLLSLESLGLS